MKLIEADARVKRWLALSNPIELDESPEILRSNVFVKSVRFQASEFKNQGGSNGTVFES